MAKINVTCNFADIFAKFNTVNDLKELANNICQQVKTAYDLRIGEINGAPASVQVIVDTDTKPAKTAKKSATSKTAKAKEAAARMKQESAAAKNTTKGTAKTNAKKEEAPVIDLTDKKAVNKLGLSITRYNERSYVLRGDTKPLRKEFKKFKGVYNSHLTGGEGWVFSNDRAAECAKALGMTIPE